MSRNHPAYLLLKASALQVPLLNHSVGMVIATPPYFGERRFRKGELCTCDANQYERWMTQFLDEAVRIVKPYRYILLFASKPETRASKVFHVFQKRVRGGRWVCVRVGSASFAAHYVDVKGFNWEALSVGLYRALMRRYSRAGETVAHLCSGSGNSGIAALEVARKPVLIDLHYHRLMQRRLRKRIRVGRFNLTVSDKRSFEGSRGMRLGDDMGK